MSTSETPTGKANVKTLAIRLEPELHAQLSVIAQLQGSTITDEIRQAIERHIEQTRSNPGLTAKADAVLEDIERDASARREAIAALFGSDTASATTTDSRSSSERTTTRKGRAPGTPSSTS